MYTALIFYKYRNFLQFNMHRMMCYTTDSLHKWRRYGHFCTTTISKTAGFVWIKKSKSYRYEYVDIRELKKKKKILIIHTT